MTPRETAAYTAGIRTALDLAQAGQNPCPSCGARFRWGKDSTNRHIDAECETADCLLVMQ